MTKIQQEDLGLKPYVCFGSSTAYELILPRELSFVADMILWVKFKFDCGNGPTLSVNGSLPLAIIDETGSPLSALDVLVDNIYQIHYQNSFGGYFIVKLGGGGGVGPGGGVNYQTSPTTGNKMTYSVGAGADLIEESNVEVNPLTGDVINLTVENDLTVNNLIVTGSIGVNVKLVNAPLAGQGAGATYTLPSAPSGDIQVSIVGGMIQAESVPDYSHAADSTTFTMVDDRTGRTVLATYIEAQTNTLPVSTRVGAFTINQEVGIMTPATLPSVINYLGQDHYDYNYDYASTFVVPTALAAGATGYGFHGQINTACPQTFGLNQNTQYEFGFRLNGSQTSGPGRTSGIVSPDCNPSYPVGDSLHVSNENLLTPGSTVVIGFRLIFFVPTGTPLFDSYSSTRQVNVRHYGYILTLYPSA